MASTFQSALTRAKKKRRVPADPPPGSYDPMFDAQGRQIQRNYDDLVQNFGIAKGRGQDDLNLALGQTQRSEQQNLADLLTNRSRLTEDHSTALSNLNRNYAVLANRQAEGALKGNVQSGGILAQSLARRQANLSADQQPINTAYQRGLADSTTAETRTHQAAAEHGDALKLAFDRAFGPSGDNVLNLARSGRDLNAGRLDLNASKWYSAAANGYAPLPKKKKRPVIV